MCQSNTSFYYPNDTILIKKQFLKRTYYLRGRELNLPVMKWLMQDVPAAKDKIQLSVWSDQMTIGSYGIGGLASFAGLVVFSDNKALGTKLLKFGGYSFGAGILFQLLSANYKRKAVKVYNLDLKQKTTDRFRLKFKTFPDKIELCLQF